MDHMQLQHLNEMYPPRVKITVTITRMDRAFKLPIKFEGPVSDHRLNVDLTFPLTLSGTAGIIY